MNGIRVKLATTFESTGSILLKPLLFADLLSITIADPDHSKDEERWVTMGLSNRHRLLVVVHTEEAETIRIISVRRADRLERRKYEEGDS